MLGEGRSIEEAIDNALAKMDVKRDDVSIEILQEPSTGLFGRKSGTAVVRLTLKQKGAAPPSKIGVMSIVNGKLKYTPAVAQGGVVPTVRFGSELHVLYKGELVENEVAITDGLEPLEIMLPEDREPELHYEIRVNPQKTKAELFWKRHPGISYSLADQAPTNQLRLLLNETSVEAPVLKLEDVRHLAQIEGLRYGLQLEKLSSETLNAPHGQYTLAIGLEPQPGKDPSIKYVFQEEATAAIDFDALRIDHYAVHGTEGVQEGAILAVKDPGRPGVSGIDVYGNPIAAEPLRKIEIALGEGVELSPDGLQAIATTSGLPSLQSGVLRVTQVFELSGDADVSTGNITMDGDIIIKGNVLENVKVESNTGVIVVNGLVSGATLRTGGSITVLRNVVRSQLFAGASVNQIRILNILQKVYHQLGSLMAAYDAIVTQADNIPFENLIKHLIELKFSDLPEDIKELIDCIAQISDNSYADFGALRETMAECVVSMGSIRMNDIDQLRQMHDSVGERILELEGMPAIESGIRVGYLQNAKIEASGAVEVTGRGCFYSTVLAGTGFKIDSGVFRGGQVVVNTGSIVAKELGGPTGIATKAHIIKSGHISASLVHPNVTVAIGPQSFKFDETTSLVRAFFHNNILTIFSGAHKIHG